MKRAFSFAILVLFTLACMTVDGLMPAPVSAPTETKFPVIIPYPNQTARPAPAKTPTPARVASTSQVFPAWVAEFSDPILKALEGQHPVYQDDFPAICLDDESKKWKVCATPEQRSYYQTPLSVLVTVTARATLDLQPSLQNGYSLLNTGWYFDVPGSPKNPFYAHIDSGALVLKLPEGKINKELIVYNQRLALKNFVLKLDFDFRNIQPNDTVRFQFNQSADQSVALDISRNKTWAFHWGFNDHWETRSGAYERFTPEHISVVIVVRDTACAAYFNNDPLDYISDCRAGAMVQASRQAVSLRLLGEPGYSSVVTVDNVMLWDLDKIPGLP